MAAAIPVAMAAATAVQAFSSIQQGRAASAAARYNAQQNQENAAIAEQQAQLQAQQQDRVNRQRAGAIRAANAANGLTSAGSVFDVLGDAAAQGELQKQSILLQGQQNVRGYRNTATLDTMQARNAATSGYLSAASDLLGGGAKAYQAYTRVG